MPTTYARYRPSFLYRNVASPSAKIRQELDRIAEQGPTPADIKTLGIVFGYLELMCARIDAQNEEIDVLRECVQELRRERP